MKERIEFQKCEFCKERYDSDVMTTITFREDADSLPEKFNCCVDCRAQHLEETEDIRGIE